ncbi:MAG TPA: formyltransferase family protein [Thermoanaerobaculia bacterium]|nr:formyltransferase family protein [Thermoanaerobaculia bacterium]
MRTSSLRRSRGRGWCLIGQCAFTYHVAAAAVARGVPLTNILVLPTSADDDPFVSLQTTRMPRWLRQHRLYHGGWRERLVALCAYRRIALRVTDDLLATTDIFAAIVVAGLARKVPDAVLQRFGSRALNVHPSLLPDLRGPQPEAQAILRGDRVVGVTIHTMTARFDDGPIRHMAAYALGPLATVGHMEALAAEHAAEGLRALAERPARNWPTIAPAKPSEYHRAYNDSVLALGTHLTVADVRRRLRLRPEGYAFYDAGGARVYPITVRLRPCRRALPLDLADGRVFVHAYVTAQEGVVALRSCACGAPRAAATSC